MGKAKAPPLAQKAREKWGTRTPAEMRSTTKTPVV